MASVTTISRQEDYGQQHRQIPDGLPTPPAFLVVALAGLLIAQNLQPGATIDDWPDRLVVVLEATPDPQIRMEALQSGQFGMLQFP